MDQLKKLVKLFEELGAEVFILCLFHVLQNTSIQNKKVSQSLQQHPYLKELFIIDRPFKCEARSVHKELRDRGPDQILVLDLGWIALSRESNKTQN